MASTVESEIWCQLGDRSWKIGGRLILSRKLTKSQGDCSWSDGADGFFVVSEAIDHHRCVSPHLHRQPDIPFPLVYDVGITNPHTIWKIGEAFLEVVKPLPHVTREHVTINAVHEMGLIAEIPQVLYHGEWDDRYYILTTEVPGLPLNESWLFMTEDEKRSCVLQVVETCKQLTSRTNNHICGIDGEHLPEFYLTPNEVEPDFDPGSLLENCIRAGLDCSGRKFVFCHCDLGPGNILFNKDDGSISIIDWEIAGYVPRDWIRTKARVCSGMDLQMSPESDDIPPHDWRSRLQLGLQEEGFLDKSASWMEWSTNK